MPKFVTRVDPYWSNVAGSSLDDIREALLTGYKTGKPFSAHNYILLRPDMPRCHVLDFGCGLGRNFPTLLRFALTIQGFDIPEMVAACTRQELPEHISVSGDWDMVSGRRYDLAVANLVLQHLIPGESLDFFLGELARVSPYLYVSTRAWCDGPGHRNLLQEILNSQHYDYVVGCLDKDDALSLEFPDDTHFDFIVRSRYVEPRTSELANLFEETDRTYVNWLRLYSPKQMDHDNYRQEISNWTDPPHLSVILPTFNSDHELLSEAIGSVIDQIYPHWELCIADDASDDRQLIDLLKNYEKLDSRIRAVFRQHHGHISVTSNAALEIAQGHFVVLLDHDDLLSPDALYWVAKTIREFPEAALIYSDEDKIDTDGNRFDPYFKSDWNPDLFLSHNMVSHLGAYRMDIVSKVGGFLPGLEGSQDYDLALRVIEHLEPHQIRHIPRVLYHWRLAPGSTAVSLSNKNYALESARKAVQQHLVRRSIDAIVEDAPDVPGQIRVRYSVGSKKPRASIVVPTRDRVDLLKPCIESILEKTDYSNYQIIVIDNDSKDDATLEYLNSIKADGIKLLRIRGSFNFSTIMNFGVENAEGDIIVSLNNDTRVINSDWLTEMVSHLVRPGVGIVGARLWFPDDTLQHAGVIMGMGGVAGHHSIGLPRHVPGYCGRAALIQNFTAVTGACLAIEKQVYLDVGGMDESLAVSFNDIDLCLKVGEKGLRVVWTPYAELYHYESASRGHDNTETKIKRAEAEADYFRSKWPGKITTDPAYSPNLCLASTENRLAFPPRTYR